MEQIPITTQGYAALKKELERLKTVERPENIKSIEVARAHGDLSENAEYHAAKERQSFLEGRIGEIGYKLGNAKVIDPKTVPKDTVRFANRVVVENLDSEEESEYMIVGPDEADIKKWKDHCFQHDCPSAAPVAHRLQRLPGRNSEKLQQQPVALREKPHHRSRSR